MSKQIEHLQGLVKDLINSDSPADQVFSQKDFVTRRIVLSSSEHIEIEYHNMETDSDNIASAKMVKTGFDRVEWVLDETEIEALSNKGYF